MNYLCLDIGTTCIKAQVFSSKGDIVFYEQRECSLKQIDGTNYADIEKIIQIVKGLVKKSAEVAKIHSIAISSFGESFVTLDKDDNILTYPMLYTDARGAEEAEEIKKMFGNDYCFKTFGACPHAMYSISKLLWIKNNFPDIFSRIDKIALICDYIGYILTGRRVIDYALASRTGMFELKNRTFSKAICDQFGIKISFFSEPKPTGTIVAKIKECICNELDLDKNTVLILGSHDQICATIGAGAIADGESADGMGTVECITSIFKDKPMETEMGILGYPIVPFINNLYCTYILNMTSNSIMQWYRENILHNYKGQQETVFDYLESDNETPTEILVLPYFSGSGTPYNDVTAKGSIVNLGLNSKDGDIYRSMMESTSYEMKYNLEIVQRYGINVKKVVATGGGANSKKWVQIKSDIFDKEVKTLRSSEGGLCGLAMICSVALGECADFATARNVFVQYKDVFVPSKKYDSIYKRKYNKYKQLYKNLKEMF